MNFLFFISLFAVTVSSNPLSPIMADPAAFVKTFQDADPEVIQNMLDLVDRLVVEGQDLLASVTSDAIYYRNYSNYLQAELAKRITELNAAQSKLEESTGRRNELTGAEAVDKAALDKATADRDSSQADHDKKASFSADTTARVNHENEEFAVVIDLLDSIVVPASEFIGRSLLSSDNADPDAIDNVKAQVQALVDAGAAEVAAADAALAFAVATLDAHLSAYASALEQHTGTAGLLQTAILDVARDTKSRDRANVAYVQADQDAYYAEYYATDAEHYLADETVRINTEEASLGEVHDLLSALLPQE